MLQEGIPIAYASNALTETEIRYAQIEKEMLAIVFACNKFRQYIYGKHNIYINTDHRPLVRIIEKPLNDISTQLQKMRLRLQQYDIKLSYIPGKELVIADALSRNYLEEISDTDIIPEVISTISLAVSDARKERIIEETSKDNICKKLIEYIETEWPSKHQIPEIMKPYLGIRVYITYMNGLLFKE